MSPAEPRTSNIWQHNLAHMIKFWSDLYTRYNVMLDMRTARLDHLYRLFLLTLLGSVFPFPPLRLEHKHGPRGRTNGWTRRIVCYALSLQLAFPISTAVTERRKWDVKKTTKSKLPPDLDWDSKPQVREQLTRSESWDEATTTIAAQEKSIPRDWDYQSHEIILFLRQKEIQAPWLSGEMRVEMRTSWAGFILNPG